MDAALIDLRESSFNMTMTGGGGGGGEGGG